MDVTNAQPVPKSKQRERNKNEVKFKKRVFQKTKKVNLANKGKEGNKCQIISINVEGSRFLFPGSVHGVQG